MRSRAKLRGMDATVTTPWTIEQFLSWAAKQEERHEFDGERPVAMTGGTARHNRIAGNIHAALRARLRGGRCCNFEPDLGVRTTGHKIRYPDALVTCTRFPDSDKLAPDVVVLFEVLSPDSGRRDRIEMVREYAAVPSIRRYVIVEFSSGGLLVLHRESDNVPFTATTLTLEDSLALPEIGIEIPVSEIYEDIDFASPVQTD